MKSQVLNVIEHTVSFNIAEDRPRSMLVCSQIAKI